MAMSQMNTRIDSALRSRGDAVFARYGLSPSEVVRAIWRYAADTGAVPDFMRREDASCEFEGARARAAEGSGLAVRLAERGGLRLETAEGSLQGATWRELRDAVYDDMLDEMGMPPEGCSGAGEVDHHGHA